MLTEADRVTGHTLAAEWLERVGERDALTMADHFQKGREPERAVPWLVQAAHSALGGGNVDATIALGDRGFRDAPNARTSRWHSSSRATWRRHNSEAKHILEGGMAFPTEQAKALGALARAELARGQPEEALAYAERGLSIESRARWHSTGSMLRLARAEALHSSHRTDEALTVVREACERILTTAATLDDAPELRASYMNIPTHARTAELARAWDDRPAERPARSS